MNKNILIIPSLNPSSEFITLLEEFKAKIDDENIKIEIIVINDGSEKKYDEIFFQIEKKGIIVLKHVINLGKGRALKTAFNYALNNFENFQNAVTADSDGQHSITDIISC